MEFTKDPSTHPANGPLTEERLIRVRDELAAAAKRSDGGNLGYMMADAAKAIDELLALRKAVREPVGYYRLAEDGVSYYLSSPGQQRDGTIPLYAAPQLPQPAVDESAIFDAAIDICRKSDSIDEHAWNHGVLAVMSAFLRCRAAMLNRQCVDHVDGVLPTTIQTAPALDSLPKNDEAPTTIKPVADLYEVTVPSGRSTTFTKDAAEAKDCADMGWKVQEYVTLERYQAAMLQGAEPVSQPYTLREGWMAVPVDMTPEQMRAVQLNSELGAYAAANLTGAYSLFREFWDVAIAAAPDFREISNSSTEHFRGNAETSTKCWCHTCRPVTVTDVRFVVCPECGNKRCPHANDHRNACTGSNEPGQEGSAYTATKQDG